MDQRLRGEESVRGAEVLDDHRVGFLDRLVGVHARLLREMAPSVDRTEDRQPEGLPEFEIFRTVTRCAVDEARVLRLDGGRGDHAMDPFPRRGRLIGDLVREGVRIGQADQLVAGRRLGDLVGGHPAAGHDGGNRRLHRPQKFHGLSADHLHLRVDELRVDRDCQIRWEGPGSRRPDQERFGGSVPERELDVDGGIRLIRVLDLRVGQGGFVAGAPLGRAEGLVEQTAFVRAAEGPPRRFNEFVPDRHVRPVPVHPDPEGPELVRHLVQQIEGELATGRDEFLDPQVLDLLLVRDPQGLLDLDLDREAMHVVPGLVSDVEATHPAKADDGVFQGLVQDIAQVDRPGRIGRAVAEVEVFPLRTRRDGLRVDLRAVPEFLDLALHL